MAWREDSLQRDKQKTSVRKQQRGRMEKRGLREERMWMMWRVCAWLDCSCRWGWTHTDGVFLWAYWFKITTHTHTHTHTHGDTGEFLWERTLFWFNRNKNEAVMDRNIVCWIATQPQVVPNQYDWLTDFHRTQKKKLKKSSGTTLWGLKFPLGFSEIKSYRFETTLGQNNILKMFQPFCTYN